MGTPEFAVPSLVAVASACEIVAAVTQPDRPRGRGRVMAASPVAEKAESLGIQVLKPEHTKNPEWCRQLAELGPDLFAVVAYGAILSRQLLSVPRLGSVNLHGSLLPDYRGASPVQHALRDGRASTGVTTLWMDEGIDTGDLILQRWVGIEPGDTNGTLAARLAHVGAPLLADSLRLAHAGRAPRVPQDRAAGSYAPKLAKQDGAIDWKLDVVAVWNRQRAMTPWPGASTGHAGHRVQITRAEPLHVLETGAEPGRMQAIGTDGIDVACGRGVLRVTRLKAEGKPEMSASEWAHGARVHEGDQFVADDGGRT